MRKFLFGFIKFILALSIFCIIMSLFAEYWQWILLALVILIGVCALCVKKGHVKPQEIAQHFRTSTKSSSLLTNDHYLAYQYDNVKFYPPTEMISKVNKKFLHPGAEVFLKQESKNKYDNRAIALYVSGHQIGYMLRGTLQDMANDYIENGWPIKATLSSLRFVGGEYQGYINLSYYRKSTNLKRLGYHDIDIKAIQPSNPNAAPNTPLSGKNIVFSGVFTLPLDEMMQIAVDAGATLKSRVSKNTNYLVVGKQDTMFLDKDGLSSKEATAAKLIEEGLADIRIIDENAFLELAHNMTNPKRHPALDDLIKDAEKKTPPTVLHKKKPLSGRVREPEHKVTDELNSER